MENKDLCLLSEDEKVIAGEMSARSIPRLGPNWYDGKQVDEVIYARQLLDKVPMVCINDTLYTPIGELINESHLKHCIAEDVSYYLATELSKKVEQIIKSVKLIAYKDEPPISCDRIALNNGTYYLGQGFREEMEFSLNRIPVCYKKDAAKPSHWLNFISELLYEEDINAFQEYMGYCLIPTNKAQKMLLILGNGGEGKSRIGLTLQAMLKDALTQGSLCDLERDRFAKANLLNKLVFFDDDMALEALPDTHKLKSIVTLEGKTDIEFKGKQSFQAPIYSRIVAVGNGTLSSLHDRSNGFYRRQLILVAKPVNPDRVNDPYLIDKLKNELEGILLWFIEGLERLIKNDYQFTISERAEDNLKTAMEEGNNIISFLNSEGYIYFEKNTKATSMQLTQVYHHYCDDNCLKPMSDKTFLNHLKSNSDKYGLTYTNNLDGGGGKKVRGFIGVHTQIRAD